VDRRTATQAKSHPGVKPCPQSRDRVWSKLLEVVTALVAGATVAIHRRLRAAAALTVVALYRQMDSTLVEARVQSLKEHHRERRRSWWRATAGTILACTCVSHVTRRPWHLSGSLLQRHRNTRG
jgi:uncharacterized Ntn-hydrolase superfamily protein